ncbi:MAG: Flp pilus assembly complex ATPase component TadA [Nitrospirae bacterium]|nr:Flp pilus assembly complex ATPase component TadA [Nitrospirota bacterium]
MPINDKGSKSQYKSLDIAMVTAILLKKGLITQDQCDLLMTKGEEHRTRMQRTNDAGLAKRHNQVRDVVTPAEAIAALGLEMPRTNNKLLTEDKVTEAIAAEYNMSYKKLDPLKLDLKVVTSHIPRPFALRHLIVPVEETRGVISMAVADPLNMEGIESIKRVKKIEIKLVLSSKSDIFKIVREFFGFQASIVAASAEMKPTIDLGNLEQYVRMRGHAEIEATDSHVVNAVEYLLQYAFDQRASDIHIEPKRDRSIVRLRIDGVMHYIHSMPKSVHSPVVSRIKMLSRMDIAEKRRPQDGRIKAHHRDKELELRVSTLPVAFGEKVVIRIFDPDLVMQELSELGFYPREYQLHSSFIRRPHGILLVTGPTGSGKTTTLYSSLKAIATPEVNIITIEDPIEMVIEEFNQVGVQPAAGITFASILRNFLRQDPDIIMVGEIRDKETAENAIQSALTGHLVFSTLHTNDAPSAITRLLDIGVPAFLISSTIVGVIAQRLVRKTCVHCKVEREMTEEEMDYLQLERKTYMISYGEGCLECRGTGYRGRTGIFEVMEFTDNLKRILKDKVELTDIVDVAKADGMITLHQAAIRKLLDGVTTYEEVISMTG